MASFALQELFRLMYCDLFFFSFGDFAFGVKSKKSLPRLMSRSLLLSFSSRCFMASGLTLKSLIHFGLVVLFYSFVCDYPVFLIPRIEMIVKTVILQFFVRKLIDLFLLSIHFWLHLVLVVARGLSCPVACGILVP